MKKQIFGKFRNAEKHPRLIHNHEVPSSILGRATRKKNPLPNGKGFFILLRPELARRRKQKKNHKAEPWGSPFLGCFLRPLQDH